MSAAPATLLSAQATSATWNWRAELAVLDATIDHVAGGDAWNWRRDLAEIEAGLDEIAARHGL